MENQINLILNVNGHLENDDVYIFQDVYGMWKLRAKYDSQQRVYYTLADVQKIMQLHAAAIEWVFESSQDGTVGKQFLDSGFITDFVTGEKYEINRFFEMCKFAKDHKIIEVDVYI